MRPVILPALLLPLCAGLAPAARGQLEVEMFLELNETDQDAEVVIEINSDDPMLIVAVLGPTGLFSLLNLDDPAELGQSEILLETAEPSIPDVLAAYPEGTYSFFTLTSLGDVLSTDVEFTHGLLQAPAYAPADGTVVDPDADLVVSWKGRDGASSYVIEVESEDEEISFLVEVPARIKSLRVPKELLLPGLEYQLGVGVKTETGNFSVAESTFVTED